MILVLIHSVMMILTLGAAGLAVFAAGNAQDSARRARPMPKPPGGAPQIRTKVRV